MQRSLAHLSDLHLGRDRGAEDAARGLCAALVAAQVDAVVVTGDLTHRGRRAELRAFEEAFAPLLDRGKVTIVPGNHDRAGDDIGATLMVGSRVGVVDLPGLHVVRVDSTAPHNRSLHAAHGVLDARDLTEIEAALAEATPGALSVVMLHHHVLPLPREGIAERVSGWLGWPNAEELPLGRVLLETIRGRCDLVLHGHRHVPAILRPFPGDPRPLAVVNAGSSTALGRARLFVHEAGAISWAGWLGADRSGEGVARRAA